MFRILSLDGGGTRGLLTSRLLANLERLLNEETGETVSIGLRFDFICGTSTGGLIALALASGKQAAEIFDFYCDLIPKIFRDGKKKRFPLWATWFDEKILERELRQILDERTLDDVATDVCVVGINLSNSQPRLFKSSYLTRNTPRATDMLSDVAMCTSAAPVIFPSASSESSVDIIDGGLCANNPSMVAVVDSLQFERASMRGNRAKSMDDLALLSIGTGRPCGVPYEPQKLRRGGFVNWAFPQLLKKTKTPPMFEIAAMSQSTVAHFQAKFLLKERYFRFDPVLSEPIDLFDTEKVYGLVNFADVTIDLQKFATSYLVGWPK